MNVNVMLSQLGKDYEGGGIEVRSLFLFLFLAAHVFHCDRVATGG